MDSQRFISTTPAIFQGLQGFGQTPAQPTQGGNADRTATTDEIRRIRGTLGMDGQSHVHSTNYISPFPRRTAPPLPSIEQRGQRALPPPPPPALTPRSDTNNTETPQAENGDSGGRADSDLALRNRIKALSLLSTGLIPNRFDDSPTMQDTVDCEKVVVGCMQQGVSTFPVYRAICELNVKYFGEPASTRYSSKPPSQGAFQHVALSLEFSNTEKRAALAAKIRSFHAESFGPLSVLAFMEDSLVAHIKHKYPFCGKRFKEDGVDLYPNGLLFLICYYDLLVQYRNKIPYKEVNQGIRNAAAAIKEVGLARAYRAVEVIMGFPIISAELLSKEVAIEARDVTSNAYAAMDLILGPPSTDTVKLSRRHLFDLIQNWYGHQRGLSQPIFNAQIVCLYIWTEWVPDPKVFELQYQHYADPKLTAASRTKNVGRNKNDDRNRNDDRKIRPFSDRATSILGEVNAANADGCWHCGQPDHIMRNCPTKPKQTETTKQHNQRHRPRGGRGGDKKPHRQPQQRSQQSQQAQRQTKSVAFVEQQSGNEPPTTAAAPNGSGSS
jgi:hypothetical protein